MPASLLPGCSPSDLDLPRSVFFLVGFDKQTASTTQSNDNSQI
jgi:hypothetical protein